MEIERDDLSSYDQEKTFLGQLITNTEILKRVFPVLDPELMSNEYSRILTRWIRDYYAETERAPGKDIESIYIKNRSLIRDKDIRKNVSTMLKRLAKNWKMYNTSNPEYNAKVITEHFRMQSLVRLSEKIQDSVDMGDFSEAESTIAGYNRIEIVGSQAVDLFKDSHIISDAFNDHTEVVLRLPGKLGEALGPFNRGELTGIVAPTKGGKSWFKLFCAQRTALNELKVIIFNFEITQRMYLRRAWQGHLGSHRNGGVIEMPYLEGNEIKYRDRTLPTPNYSRMAILKEQKKMKTMLNGGGLKIVTIPRGKATLTKMEQELSYQEKEGFLPDLIIVDYADILRSGRKFDREQKEENFVWEALAGMAVERNAHIMTSTQGNRKSFDGQKYGIEGLGGFYDKLSHAGKIFGIVVGAEERAHGLSRIQYWYERDGLGSFREVTVLTGFSIGRMYLDSIFTDEIEGIEDDDE